MTGISVRTKEAFCMCKFATSGQNVFMYCARPGRLPCDRYFYVIKKQKFNPVQEADGHSQAEPCLYKQSRVGRNP